MSADDYGVRAIGVKSLLTQKLRANPHNPRMLFDREDLHILRQSIDRVGILVPLTVYREAGTGHYVILDGQRRWMCAQEVGLEKIPVNEVAEPTLVQNIVTMFQIHKLRKDWELMPTALKLELLMRELGEKKEKRLAELTGLDEAVVVRCKKLLSYNKRYQDSMLDADPSKRVKADFFTSFILFGMIVKLVNSIGLTKTSSLTTCLRRSRKEASSRSLTSVSLSNTSTMP
jgi:ParB family chromosome partitioning protein